MDAENPDALSLRHTMRYPLTHLATHLVAAPFGEADKTLSGMADYYERPPGTARPLPGRDSLISLAVVGMERGHVAARMLLPFLQMVARRRQGERLVESAGYRRLMKYATAETPAAIPVSGSAPDWAEDAIPVSGFTPWTEVDYSTLVAPTKKRRVQDREYMRQIMAKRRERELRLLRAENARRPPEAQLKGTSRANFLERITKEWAARRLVVVSRAREAAGGALTREQDREVNEAFWATIDREIENWPEREGRR